jgi:hypothetical protein
LKPKTNIAVFVSSHGFGHAARISAIMTSLKELLPEIHFEVFTEVPNWFFLDSLHSSVFNYHVLKTDIGLIQKSPLEEDLPVTLDILKKFIPFENSVIESIAGKLKNLNCAMVLCDISPLGIAIAKNAGLPSVLIENFTWDWIYEGYAEFRQGFNPFIEYLNRYFKTADFRIQTEPVCHFIENSMHVNPVSRSPKNPVQTTQKKLGIQSGRKVILITLGGVPAKHDYIEQLQKFKDIDFILPINVDKPRRDGNCIILPHHSDFYHPDLVAASDAVIGKLGYSTLAEVYQAGIPFGFITRDAFRESKPLSVFVENTMPSIKFTQDDFVNGTWIQAIPELLALEREDKNRINGAGEAASLILKLFG